MKKELVQAIAQGRIIDAHNLSRAISRYAIFLVKFSDMEGRKEIFETVNKI